MRHSDGSCKAPYGYEVRDGEDIDVSDVVGAAAETIRALEEELGKANERIEELETELEEAS